MFSANFAYLFSPFRIFARETKFPRRLANLPPYPHSCFTTGGAVMIHRQNERAIRLSRAREQAMSINKNDCVVSAFNDIATQKKHKKTSLADLEKFLRGEGRGYYGRLLDTLEEAVSRTTRSNNNDVSVDYLSINIPRYKHLFDVTKVQSNKPTIYELFNKIEGEYLCFFKTYERDNKMHRFEVVRYNISEIKDGSFFYGMYSTHRLAKLRAEDEAVNDLEFIMLAMPRKDSFAVIHFNDTEGKSIIYSLLKQEQTHYGTFFSGTTVRDASHGTKVLAYKVLWIPKKGPKSNDDIPEDMLFSSNDLDSSSVQFLEKILEHRAHEPTSSYFEIGTDPSFVIRDVIEDYARECKGLPFIRLSAIKPPQ